MPKDPLEELFSALKTAVHEEKRETVVLVSGWPGMDRNLLFYMPKEGRLQVIDDNYRSHGYVDPRLAALGYGMINLEDDLRRAIEKVRQGKIDVLPNHDD